MSIYKDCDIRGIYGEEFDEKDAYLIGRAVGTLQRGKRLAVGGDIRLSTPVLKASLMRGLMETGIHVIDGRLCDHTYVLLRSGRSGIWNRSAAGRNHGHSIPQPGTV